MNLRFEFMEHVKFHNRITGSNLNIKGAKDFFSTRMSNSVDTSKVKVPALQKFILTNTGEIGFKNKTVLHTIKTILSDKPITFHKLNEMFNPTDLRLKKVFEEVDKITEKEKQHPRRYFTKEEELLKTGDGKLIALTTQWGNNFPEFIKIALRHGYKIKKYNQP